MEIVVERSLLELRSGNGGERVVLMSVKRAKIMRCTFSPPLCQLPLASTFFKGGRTM